MSRFLHPTCFLLIFHLFWTSKSVLSQVLKRGGSEENVGSVYFFYQTSEYPRDCTEARNQCSTDNLNGIYLIKPDGLEPFEVYCDNTIDSGGWTVIYRFQNGLLHFNRNWTEIKSGFGFLSEEFWIGNDKLSFLTNQKSYELRIDVTSTDGLSFYVAYNSFRISDEFGEYKLTRVGDYSGTEDNITKFFCPSSSEQDFFVAPDCSRRCDCRENELVCDKHYRCSPNASCEERHNVRQCYCNKGFVGNGKNCTLAKDCYDILNTGYNNSGIYTIQPSNWIGPAFEVFCNMENGGGWTVFQRRVNGSVDFYNGWEDYKQGFGFLDHEFWLGNDKLFSLTNQADYELRIDLVDRLGSPFYATYDMFRIANEDNNYTLTYLGTFNGTTVRDALANSKGYAFSTYDRDNDGAPNMACAKSRHGAWWYKFCANANLNGDYSKTRRTSSVYWRNLPGGTEVNQYTEMKIRPIRN